MEGKVVLLTGGNSGIGKTTALGLAAMGAELVLVCRDDKKAEQARAEIVKATGNGSVGLVIADLLAQKEVRRAAAEFLGTHTRLDVLVNNAGAYFMGYAATEDGVERTMAVNYFAPFLLTNLLLEALKKSAPSRVVNVASNAHYRGRVDPDDLSSADMGIGGWGAYGRSKLALVLFTYELARRLRGTGVTANCLHPGTVRTNLLGHAGAFSGLMRLGSVFMIGAAKGAETPIYLSSSPDVEGVTGKYFEKREPKLSAKASYDEALAARLWEVSARVTGLAEAPAPVKAP